MDSGGLVQIPVDVPNPSTRVRRRRGSDETCPGARKLQRFRCMQAGSLAWLAEPHNPYSNCTVKTRQQGIVTGTGSRMASCGSFLSCLQRHYSNGKSVQQHRLLLFLVGCGAGASAGAVCCAGLGCSGCHARGRIRTAHSSLTRSSSFPPAPSGRCGSQREGPLHAHSASVAVLPAAPGVFKHSHRSGPRHSACAERHEVIYSTVCSGPGRHPVPCEFPVIRCTHRITQQDSLRGVRAP